MRELTVNEVTHVSGGTISSEEAGRVLESYFAGIIGGAAIGALTGGPLGILGGAIFGAGRVAVGGGIAALLLGTWNLH